MKTTRAVYIVKSDNIVTKEGFANALFIHGEDKLLLAPKGWIFLGEVEIDIPDSIIDDIIGANTETDIEKQIAKHEAEITKLVEFRNRGK